MFVFQKYLNNVYVLHAISLFTFIFTFIFTVIKYKEVEYDKLTWLLFICLLYNMRHVSQYWMEVIYIIIVCINTCATLINKYICNRIFILIVYSSKHSIVNNMKFKYTNVENRYYGNKINIMVIMINPSRVI